jgi:hypothetical protein
VSANFSGSTTLLQRAPPGAQQIGTRRGHFKTLAGRHAVAKHGEKAFNACDTTVPRGRRRMHARGRLCSALLGLATTPVFAAAAGTLTVNDSGDAGNGTCTTTCTLRDAIANVADGGVIQFDHSILPATITLQHGALSIQKSLQIAGPGPGKLAVSGASLSRLIEANTSGTTIIVADLTLRDGAVVGGNGGNATAGTGGSGTNGDSVEGGCIRLASATLDLERVAVRHCLAQAGNGGSGGSGTPGSGFATGGPGGSGGAGGNARGGAIFLTSAAILNVEAASIIDSEASAGSGGAGGDGGTAPFYRGSGGGGGRGGDGSGGAIHCASAQTELFVKNSTVARDKATAGNGANGGLGDPALATSAGGKGGDGGNAEGGLVNCGDFLDSAVEFSTLAEGTATAGISGAGGAAKSAGSGGVAGHQVAEALFAVQGFTPIWRLWVHATAIVGTFNNFLCTDYFAGFYAAGPNLSESPPLDGCDASLQGSLQATFRPLAEDAELPYYMPRYASAVIDSAGLCLDSHAVPVSQDGQSTPRPQGGGCDIGAVEADYVFFDGFDG